MPPRVGKTVDHYIPPNGMQAPFDAAVRFVPDELKRQRCRRGWRPPFGRTYAELYSPNINGLWQELTPLRVPLLQHCPVVVGDLRGDL